MVLELESATARPPVPAGEVSVMVPVLDPPLRIVDGLIEMLLKAAGRGLIVMLATLLIPE